MIIMVIIYCVVVIIQMYSMFMDELFKIQIRQIFHAPAQCCELGAKAGLPQHGWAAIRAHEWLSVGHGSSNDGYRVWLCAVLVQFEFFSAAASFDGIVAGQHLISDVS